MAKVDHPALLAPGVHSMTEQALFQLTVSAFADQSRRGPLYGLFATWVQRMRSYGISGTLWIDGSFLTAKPDPDDIDLVLWAPVPGRQLAVADQQQVGALLDKNAARFMYGLDLYVVQAAAVLQRRPYWSNLFGHGHDGVSEKGIAEVAL